MQENSQFIELNRNNILFSET